MVAGAGGYTLGGVAVAHTGTAGVHTAEAYAGVYAGGIAYIGGGTHTVGGMHTGVGAHEGVFSAHISPRVRQRGAIGFLIRPVFFNATAQMNTEVDFVRAHPSAPAATADATRRRHAFDEHYPSAREDKQLCTNSSTAPATVGETIRTTGCAGDADLVWADGGLYETQASPAAAMNAITYNASEICANRGCVRARTFLPLRTRSPSRTRNTWSAFTTPSTRRPSTWSVYRWTSG